MDRKPMIPSRTPLFKKGLGAVTVPLLLLTLAACATKPPPHENQRFVPVSRAMQGLGLLEFNNQELRLEALDGPMKLQYVGSLGEVAGENLAGAAVYRIKNADKFFEHNRDRKAFCAQPVRWIALNSTTGAPAWSSEIWFAMLTLEDWQKFAINTGGYCGGGKYIRASSPATGFSTTAH
jgi:hypothetical protein